MTLTEMAERAKTSTEAEARSRVTWGQLQELASARNVAKKAYFAHKKAVDDGEINVTFDLEEMALLRANTKAELAYQDALKRYQDQSK